MKTERMEKRSTQLEPVGRDDMSPLTQRALDIDERGNGLVTYLDAALLPAGPVLIEGKGATDWLVLDTRIDPHMKAQALGMPRAARRKVKRVADAGIDFDVLYIGHELPPGTIARAGGKDLAVKDIDSLLGPPPRDERAAKLADGTAQVLKVLGMAAGVVAVGAAAIAAAPVVLLLGPGAAALDPVILGAVTADGGTKPGQVAAFFYVVHWNAK